MILKNNGLSLSGATRCLWHLFYVETAKKHEAYQYNYGVEAQRFQTWMFFWLFFANMYILYWGFGCVTGEAQEIGQY